MNLIHGFRVVPPLPSLHALRAFEAAARRGGFARAAEELHLTPSAVSHQVRGLERALGRRLFERTRRQVALTPEGARLAATLTGAFAAIAAACAELAPHSASQSARTLAVHCAPSFAATWLGPRLPALLAATPGLNIRLTSDAEPIDLARRSEIDVAIAYGAPPVGPGIAAWSLGEEEIVALCAPPIERARAAAADGLGRFVRLDSAFSPARWSDWLALNGLPADAGRPGPAFDRGALVVAAAVQGLGVALETTRFAEAELASGALVRFGGDRFRAIRRPLHTLLCRTAEADAPRIRAFRAWLLADATRAAAG